MKLISSFVAPIYSPAASDRQVIDIYVISRKLEIIKGPVECDFFDYLEYKPLTRSTVDNNDL